MLERRRNRPHAKKPAGNPAKTHKSTPRSVTALVESGVEARALHASCIQRPHLVGETWRLPQKRWPRRLPHPPPRKWLPKRLRPRRK
ncbi:hypothetical protein E2P84_01865 [Burkholderia cepacia]|uniref:Uncharacterized protein n=1 Tax=Burkholderia cepacia TaxID=292 RepID=A0AAX2RXU1_BURCE|nr:hypothetical protein CEQ23_27385 [Burkholderia cepacia]MCR5895842.1 hypothetical protein [Burkholderia sp. HAN2018]QCY06227.1 hypothetical protein EJ998_24670 [Burkholderia cepacia ATCC 25416]THJ57236.1 hypothetical protein E9536_02670 [Burkholderia sp. LS-044]ATF81828.1 hypothetical protein CO711_31480 [Burkholderia cepacia]